MTKRQTDINGFIEIRDNPISQAGIYEYYGSEIDAPEPNRLYRVLRSPESLQNAVDKFKGVPIVNDHTMIGDGQTPPEKKGIDGAIGDDVYFKDNTVFANIRLYTNRIKDLINKGKKELSVGYWSQYEFVKGNWNGKPYDAIQHIVGGNHLALVDEGRMGKSIAVLDHKPRFNHLTITFDQKAIQMNEEEMNDAVPTEDIEEASETDANYESEEHAEKEMQTLQSILESVNRISDRQTQIEEKLAKFFGEETKEPEHQEEVEPVEDEMPTDTEEVKEEMLDTKATEDRIAKHIQAEFTAKQRAVEFVKPLVGTADHSARSSKEVWQYAASKLELTGDAETAVKAYAKAKSQARATVTQDSKPIPATHKHNGRFTGE